MRNFDSWNRYLDNNNKPLHGCVMFNVKDGNTVAPIYDSDGTDLDNPILTDEYGRTQHQVFVDVDVIAYFYKYIGEGNFQSLRSQDIDINDDTLWSLQYTVDNINDILAHITSDTVVSVPNMSALRNLDIDTVPEVYGTKVITLLGYNWPGDKEPVNYIWYPSLTDNDDNGSIIQGTELTGRWVMVKPTEHCDSRHFGIFPQNTTNFTADTARLAQWIDYCNNAKVRPYFSANGDYKYYKYNSFAPVAEVMDIAESVTFIDDGSNNIFTCEFNGNPYFLNHNTNISSSYVKTSWNANQFISPKHVVIDNESNNHQFIYSNATIDVNTNISNEYSFTNCTVNCNASVNGICTFTNCQVNSKNKISTSSYFNNCQLTEDMFYGSPYIHVDGNCIADFDDFEHKALMWLRIKDQQGQINYDWKGRLTDQNPWENVVDADRWLINYKGTNSSAVLKESDNAHTYYLENCAGTITLQGKAANTYYFKDCEIIVKFANGYNQGCTISASNSTISISQDRVRLNRFNLQNSNLIGTGSVDTDYASIYNTIQNIDVYSGYCDMKDSNVGTNVTIQVYGIDAESSIHVDPQPEVTATHAEYDVTRIISGNFVNNFVNGTIEIGTIDVNDPHLSTIDLVRGLTVKDNIGLGVTPIKVDRSLTNIYDNYNIYTYQGNTGTMAMVTDTIGTINSPGYTSGPGILAAIDDKYGGTCTTADKYFAEIKLFTIGTQNVVTKILAEALTSSSSKLNQMHPGGSFSSAGINTVTTYPDTLDNLPSDISKSGTNQFSWYLRNFIIGAQNFTNGTQLNIRISQI